MNGGVNTSLTCIYNVQYDEVPLLQQRSNLEEEEGEGRRTSDPQSLVWEKTNAQSGVRELTTFLRSIHVIRNMINTEYTLRRIIIKEKKLSNEDSFFCIVFYCKVFVNFHHVWWEEG